MKRKEYHVVHQNGKWAVKRENAKKTSNVYKTKKKAMIRGRDLSKKYGAELIPHKKDGKIQNPDSYGNDPHPPNDKK